MKKTMSLVIVLFALVLMLMAGMGASRFEFSNDYREFFSTENPQLRAWEDLQKAYTKSDNILIAVSPKEGTIYQPHVIDAVRNLTQAGWQIPYSTRVDSLTNFQHIQASDDELVIGDLLYDDEPINNENVKKIERVVIDHPRLINLVVSPNATSTSVNITVQLSEKPREQIEEIADYMKPFIETVKANYPNLDFYVSGAVPFNYSLANATKEDLKSVILLMYLLVLLILLVMFRSILLVLCSLLLIVMTTVFSMGLAGWAGTLLMAPSLSAPTILMTVVVANLVHIFLAFHQHFKDGTPKLTAIQNAFRINRKPIVITNVTTSLGFLSMNFSDVPPYRDLGNIVAVGVFVAMLLTLYVLPRLLHLMPLAPKSLTIVTPGLYRWIGETIIRRPWRIIGIFVIILGAGFYGVTRLELNDQFVEWLSDKYEFRTDTDYINKELTGIYRLDWSLNSGEPEGISDPEYLTTLKKLSEWAKAQPGVLHVSSVVETFKELNQNIHGGDVQFYLIPESKDLAAQLLLLYEMSLPLGLDINNSINVDKSASRFVIRTSNLSANELLVLERRVVSWLETNANSSMRSEAASTSILFAHIAKRNIKALLTGTLLALVMISIVMIVPLKSLKFGLASLIPNLFPALVAFGIWGLLVGHVGLAISIVIGMTMGVIVDDSVHFMVKYLHYRRQENADAPTATLKTLESVGPALISTSIMLILGFSVLAFLSGFEINTQMGALTSITIAVALFADLLLLPAILLVIDRSSKPVINSQGE